MELCKSGDGHSSHCGASLTKNGNANRIMITQFLSRLFYGSLVMLGVVVIVFFLFQGFGDPARLILGQRADAGTLNNIRKDLYLDQPKWKQFVFYLNDVSPISIYNEEELKEKNIHWIGVGGKNKLVLKFPYLR